MTRSIRLVLVVGVFVGAFVGASNRADANAGCGPHVWCPGYVMSTMSTGVMSYGVQSVMPTGVGCTAWPGDIGEAAAYASMFWRTTWRLETGYRWRSTPAGSMCGSVVPPLWYRRIVMDAFESERDGNGIALTHTYAVQKNFNTGSWQVALDGVAVESFASSFGAYAQPRVGELTAEAQDTWADGHMPRFESLNHLKALGIWQSWAAGGGAVPTMDTDLDFALKCIDLVTVEIKKGSPQC